MRMSQANALAPGMLVRTVDEDFLVLADEVSPSHGQHILCHEIGHVVLDHPVRRSCGMSGDALAEPFDADTEVEAERFAYLLGWRLRRQLRRPPLTSSQLQLRSVFGARRHLRGCNA
ncbi:hypothetical protein [Sciscionella marina]|uniref:hypothetical protein n=1 Tax=Sciscionella marina TaxID=508770 RepID=UPI00146DBF3B|nr:hypothetical protein [Sciscionella marina]